MGEPRDDAPNAAGLLAAIQRDPDDPAPYAVLADLLQAAGDPHGELIAVQLARSASDTPALRDAEHALRRDHEARLLGDIVAARAALAPPRDHDRCELDWRHGFIDRVRVQMISRDAEIVALVRALLAAPIAMPLRTLDLRLAFDDQAFMDALVATIVGHCPPSLRELTVTSFRRHARGLEQVWARIPRLRSLRLSYAGALDLGDFDLPMLEQLELFGVGRAALTKLLARTPPRLRTLWLRLEDQVPIDKVTPIVGGAIPTLRDLRLFRHEKGLDLEHLELGEIRSLALAPVTRRTLRVLAGGACAELERLDVEFADEVRRADLRPLFDGTLPRLRELGLGYLRDRPVLDALLESSLLPQLAVVDLLEFDAALLRWLVDHAAAFAHCQTLRLVRPSPVREDEELRLLAELARALPHATVIDSRLLRRVT